MLWKDLDINSTGYCINRVPDEIHDCQVAGGKIECFSTLYRSAKFQDSVCQAADALQDT